MTNSNPPVWVQLAFSSINSRKGAWILIGLNLLITLYCLPWSLFFSSQWVASVFLAPDWSWSLMMLVVLGWYLASYSWMEKNGAWA